MKAFSHSTFLLETLFDFSMEIFLMLKKTTRDLLNSYEKHDLGSMKLIDYEPYMRIEPLPHTFIYRIKSADKMQCFANRPEAQRQNAFCICPEYGELIDSTLMKAIVYHRNKLKNINAIYFGGENIEDGRLNWVENTNLGLVLDALPNLNHLYVWGGIGLRLKPQHASFENLTTLEIGFQISQNTIKDILSLQFPNLQILQLDFYTYFEGFRGTIEVLHPLLRGNLFPSLKYLGLRRSEIADDIAEAIQHSNLLDQIEALDLSMGSMTDKGAELLLQTMGDGKYLNLSYNFLSNEYVNNLRGSFSELIGPVVDLSDQEIPVEDGCARWW